VQAFGGNPLYLGGPVELRVLGVVHGVPGVTGAEEVTPVSAIRIRNLQHSI
jgi:hypothetical protein